MKASVIRCGLTMIFTETLMQNALTITCVDITLAPALCLRARSHSRRMRAESERHNPLVDFIIENLIWIMVLRNRRQDIFAMSRMSNSEVTP
jgi:hypothetical protein